jgi:CubicO group peptidase (beta-lactamase class C family)
LGDTPDVSNLPATLLAYEARLHEAVDPVRLPSIAYGIARGQETLLIGAAGIADKVAGRAATTRTPYSLASVTKPMTATAIMLLADRGLIHLDAPINDYLGEAKLDGKGGDAGEATVRRVANHTSGLPLHFQFFYEDEPYVRPSMDETIRRYGKLYTPPGERYYYSNLGYGVLDYVIERVSKRSYGSFLDEEVFGPLGMTQSKIGPPPDAAIPYGADGVAYPWYDFDHPGGSAAFSSVEDLLAFGRFHLGHGPALLSRSGIEEMHRRTATSKPGHGYGLGWGINEDRLGFDLVQHTGSMGGVTTILRLVPALDLVIATVTNGESGLASRSADEALAAISPEFRERLAAEPAMAPVAGDPVPEAFQGQWEGRIETYEGDRAFALHIEGSTKATARLGGCAHVVDELQIRDGRLLGVFDGDLRTPDASRRPYRIHLDLTPTPDRLHGAAVTLSHTPDPGGAPGKRMGNALAYWTELRRR